jgi:hypothetical protein
MRFIAGLTGEEMVDKGRAVAVNKIPDQIPLTPEIEDFEELAGDNKEHGVLITWDLSPESICFLPQEKTPRQPIRFREIAKNGCSNVQ